MVVVEEEQKGRRGEDRTRREWRRRRTRREAAEDAMVAKRRGECGAEERNESSAAPVNLCKALLVAVQWADHYVGRK